MHTKPRAVRHAVKYKRDDEDDLLPGVEDMPLGPKPDEQASEEEDSESVPGEQ